MHLSYMQVARESRCWANLSNYARLHAVYEEGGIYLDTDVEILKKFDSLLDLDCFFGFESNQESERLLVNNAVFGARKRHPFIGQCKAYLLANFPGSEPSNLSAPELVTHLLSQKGLSSYGDQEIEGTRLLGREYFYPHGWKESFSPDLVKPNTIAIHHWGRSWWGGTYVHHPEATVRKKKGKARRMLSIYKRYGLDGVKLFRDGIVRYGPFRGLKFQTTRRKPEIFAKLIGSFNNCIHQAIYDLMNHEYSRIVVCGCNDGYYGAGFARVFPEAKIYIYPESVAVAPAIQKNVKGNQLGERVHVANSRVSFESFRQQELSSPCLIFLASHKASRDLLKKESLPYLSEADIIAANPAGGETEKNQIIRIFDPSHQVRIFQERQIPAPIFQYLESTKSGTRLLNLIDKRTMRLSSWFFMRRRRPAV